MNYFMFNINKLLSVISLAALCFIFQSCSDSQTRHSAPETHQATYVENKKISEETRSEIESVIFDNYVGGQILGSKDILKSAFRVDSVMLLPIEKPEGGSKIRKWTDMHTTVSGWAEKANPNLDKSDFEVLSMDVVDNRMAVVLFKVENRVYDALTLVKIEDGWQIVSKVFIEQ